MAALTSGSALQPPGAAGSGNAARRVPASRSSRIVASSSEAPARASSAVMRRRPRPSPWARPPRLDPRARRPPPSTSPSVRRSSTRRVLGPAASGSSGARTSSRSIRPMARSAALAGTGLGAPWKLARNRGSHRAWRRRASSQSPARAASHSAAIPPGTWLPATETTPSPPIASTASVAASSPASTATSRGRSRQITASCSMLPLASLIAVTRGCSASRRNVSASTLVPVREGTL